MEKDSIDFDGIGRAEGLPKRTGSEYSQLAESGGALGCSDITSVCVAAVHEGVIVDVIVVASDITFVESTESDKTAAGDCDDIVACTGLLLFTESDTRPTFDTLSYAERIAAGEAVWRSNPLWELSWDENDAAGDTSGDAAEDLDASSQSFPIASGIFADRESDVAIEDSDNKGDCFEGSTGDSGDLGIDEA